MDGAKFNFLPMDEMSFVLRNCLISCTKFVGSFTVQLIRFTNKAGNQKLLFKFSPAVTSSPKSDLDR